MSYEGNNMIPFHKDLETSCVCVCVHTKPVECPFFSVLAIIPSENVYFY